MAQAKVGIAANLIWRDCNSFRKPMRFDPRTTEEVQASRSYVDHRWKEKRHGKRSEAFDLSGIERREEVEEE